MGKATYEHGKHDDLVPPNTGGKQNDLSDQRIFTEEGQARQCYADIKEKLLQPWRWQEISGTQSVSFALIDSEGKGAKRNAREGDYYRIDLAGPGTITGKGYDWVAVDAIRESANDEGECFGITVMAKPAPFAEEPDAAHFFQEGASSSFIVERKQTKVSVSYHGRNELPNIHTDHIIDNIRNAVAGVAAMMGLSEMQWSALLKGLLEKE